MAEFTITLTGNVDADDARAVFEDAVRALRAAAAEFVGNLEADGVSENETDVSEEPPADEDDDQTADPTTEEEVTPEEPAAPSEA